MTLDSATAAEAEASSAAVETVNIDLPTTQPIDISALLRQQEQTHH